MRGWQAYPPSMWGGSLHLGRTRVRVWRRLHKEPWKGQKASQPSGSARRFRRPRIHAGIWWQCDYQRHAHSRVPQWDRCQRDRWIMAMRSEILLTGLAVVALAVLVGLSVRQNEEATAGERANVMPSTPGLRGLEMLLSRSDPDGGEGVSIQVANGLDERVKFGLGGRVERRVNEQWRNVTDSVLASTVTKSVLLFVNAGRIGGPRYQRGDILDGFRLERNARPGMYRFVRSFKVQGDERRVTSAFVIAKG